MNQWVPLGKRTEMAAEITFSGLGLSSEYTLYTDSWDSWDGLRTHQFLEALCQVLMELCEEGPCTTAQM